MVEAVMNRPNNTFYKHRNERESRCKEYVELEEDMYCITICAYFSSENFSPIELQNLFQKCLMVFFCQIMVAYFFYHELTIDVVVQRPQFEP